MNHQNNLTCRVLHDIESGLSKGSTSGSDTVGKSDDRLYGCLCIYTYTYTQTYTQLLRLYM